MNIKLNGENKKSGNKKLHYHQLIVTVKHEHGGKGLSFSSLMHAAQISIGAGLQTMATDGGEWGDLSFQMFPEPQQQGRNAHSVPEILASSRNCHASSEKDDQIF